MKRLVHYEPPSPGRLLRHVLERPELVREVRALAPAELGKLLDFVGLEGAGELVALATTAQLERVFDEDLWASERAGDDPVFDSKRFATWLEVLLEAGEEAVVRRLRELPEDFVTLAVARSLLVVDIDALGISLSEYPDELEPIEKALESLSYEEWEEFRLIARDQNVFDSLVAVLLALDREHHADLRRILERCAAMSQEFIADNGGLYDVLTSDEMLEADNRAVRDERRGAVGHVAPSDAKSFLELARRGLGDEASRDPVTRAYFRELVRSDVPQTSETELARILARATSAEAKARPGRTRRQPRKRLGSTDEAVPTSHTALTALEPSLLEVALGELREHDAPCYAERMEELAYLANVLVAGYSEGTRRLRPVEGLELAVTTCTRALEAALERAGTPGDRLRARELLTKTALDVWFRAGFRASR